MNKFERMDIVLKIDDAVQTMTEVVTSLQDQLSTEDFSFMEDGWQQNDGFTNACEAKLELLRDTAIVAYKKFANMKSTINFQRSTDPIESRKYSFNEAVPGTPDYEYPVMYATTCPGILSHKGDRAKSTEHLMTYGPTALADAREDQKDETMCRSLAKYLGFNEDKTEKLIEVTLTMQPLMNSIVNDWGGMSEDEKEVAAKNIAEIYTGMI